jgi:hypothetical protein
MQPAMTAIGADRQNDQDRITPELERSAIGPGKQILVNPL